jgi:hypothetical protein
MYRIFLCMVSCPPYVLQLAIRDNSHQPGLEAEPPSSQWHLRIDHFLILGPAMTHGVKPGLPINPTGLDRSEFCQFSVIMVGNRGGVKYWFVKR